MVNGLPKYPIRICLKNTGPGMVILMTMATTTKRGDKQINPTIENKISKAFFIKILLKYKIATYKKEINQSEKTILYHHQLFIMKFNGLCWDTNSSTFWW